MNILSKLSQRALALCAVATLTTSALVASDDNTITPADIGFAKGFVRAFSPEAGRLLDQLTQAAAAKDHAQIRLTIQSLKTLGVGSDVTNILWQGAEFSDAFNSIQEQCGDGLGQLAGGLVKWLLESPRTASVYSVTTDHNVTRGQETGMVIHVDLAINGSQHSPCKVVAYFKDANETSLKDFDNSYSSAGGQVCAALNVTPKYEDTRFQNGELFIPYSQLHMVPGRHDLKYTVRVWSVEQKQFIGPEWQGENFSLNQR